MASPLQLFEFKLMFVSSETNSVDRSGGFIFQWKYMFSSKERFDFVSKTFEAETKVYVKTYDGLTVDFCKKNNAEFIIRGLRNPADFEFEKSIALTNREMTGIETVFFLTSPKNSFISSSIVRDLIKNKGDYKLFIPNEITI